MGKRSDWRALSNIRWRPSLSEDNSMRSSSILQSAIISCSIRRFWSSNQARSRTSWQVQEAMFGQSGMWATASTQPNKYRRVQIQVHSCGTALSAPSFASIMNQRRGSFIVIEGLDRSGKSTQADALVRKLEAANMPAKLMKFPGQSPLPRSSRELAKF